MEYVISRKEAIKEAISIIAKHRDSVQAALENYTAAADSCEGQTLSSEELKQNIKTSIDKAVKQLDKAEDYLSQFMTLQIKLESTSIKDNSYGTPDVARPKKESGVATLELQDAYGQKHEITVMKLSVNPDPNMIKPELLLGYRDSLNSLDDRSKMNITLPLGIKLITSGLGYFVTGGHSRHIDRSSKNMDTPYESTQTETTVIERKCEHEARTTKLSDAQEFMVPQEQERQIPKDIVWQQFQTTIEKRRDGYYVRLPWKSNVSTLPANKGRQ
ncbi:hypothetical protein DICVIV_12596 [Dictyocaulus viviparus]|uniref:Uncharacterized protein n=1 Tax=Dictyocaulus viviparus TaxID=29172 RepID=A0A0D8XGC2_DICVI|nr:hypothetical protein DICVIV_12596 [Dictyocaulus viviparus]